MQPIPSCITGTDRWRGVELQKVTVFILMRKQEGSHCELEERGQTKVIPGYVIFAPVGQKPGHGTDGVG